MPEFLCRQADFCSRKGNYHIMKRQSQSSSLHSAIAFQFSLRVAGVIMARDHGLEAAPECVKVSE